MLRSTKSKETLENTHDTQGTLSDSFHSKSNSFKNSQDQYPQFLKDNNLKKNRFQHSLKRFKKENKKRVSHSSKKQPNDPKYSARISIKERFLVQAINEEDLIQENNNNKQTIKVIRPKLRLVLDNEFMVKKDSKGVRARSLELKGKRQRENELPSIKEEQEYMLDGNHLLLTKGCLDLGEYQPYHLSSNSQLCLSLNHQYNYNELIDEEQELGEEGQQLSCYEEEEDLTSNYSYNQSSQGRSSWLKVDEIEMSSHRSKYRLKKERKDQLVIKEEEDILYDDDKESAISLSLSNDRTYLKKIIKGEMLVSKNNCDWKLIAHQPTQQHNEMEQPIDEMMSQEESNKELSSGSMSN